MLLMQNNAWATQGTAKGAAVCVASSTPCRPGALGEQSWKCWAWGDGLRKHILLSVWFSVSHLSAYLTVDLFSRRAQNHSRLPELKLGLNYEGTWMCWPCTLTKQSLGMLRLSGRGAGGGAEAPSTPQPQAPAVCHRACRALLPPSITRWPPSFPRVAGPSFLHYKSFT